MELDIKTIAAMYEDKLFLPGILFRLFTSLTLPLTLLDFATDWFSSGMFQIINTIVYSPPLSISRHSVSCQNLH